MRTDILFAVLAVFAAGSAQGHSDATGFAGAGGHDHPPEDTETVIRLDSPLIRTAEVVQRNVTDLRPAIGTVVADTGSTHDVNAFISGQVKRVFVRTGHRVSRGDPIALIDSPEFVLTQKAYVALLGNQEKLDILDGEGRLGNYIGDARENLRWWGLDDADIEALEETGKPLEGITVRAKVDGVISEVLVEPGVLLNAGDRNMAQFVVMGQAIARVVADDEPLWLEVLVYPGDAAGVRAAGARVRVDLPDGTQREYPVESLSPSLDPARQLVRVMLRLDRREGFYPGQPLRVALEVPRRERLWLPRSALMQQGFDAAVYVERADGGYLRRTVGSGRASGDWVPVSGLAAGTRVVTQGKMALEGAYRLLRAGVSADDHHH